MIKFHRVGGFVTIDDRKRLQCMPLEVGMTVPLVGADFIIVTGADGIVELEINNHYVLVAENSYLHVRPDGRSFLSKHKQKIFGKNSVKMGCGKIWAQIMAAIGKEDGDEILQGNSAVGVRG